MLLALAGCSPGGEAPGPVPAAAGSPPANAPAPEPAVPEFPAPEPAVPPPNILFILADDLGAEASSLYPALAGAAGQAPMPTIEALAAQGLVFDNAWANPVCSPTRAAILTGLYGHRTGVTYAGDFLPVNTTTSIFARIAAASPHAYEMALFGKWHLGYSTQHLRDHGVPEFRGIVGGGIGNYFDWTYTDLNDQSTRTTSYATTAITDFAIEFIGAHTAESDDPWFVWLAYNAPHGTGASTGFQVPPAALHTIDVGGLAPGTIADRIPVYQAMVQALDTEIGRLLEAIGPVGTPERDNTIVIFMGDNGTPAAVKDPDAGVRGSKSSVYEGGARVPLMLSGPVVTRRGEREAALVTASDLYATLAELAGIDLGRSGDSHSIVPLLTGTTNPNARTFAFTEMCTSASYYAIRDSRYKLSYNAGSRGLYDLDADPREADNRFGDAGLSAERTVLESELAALQQAATAGCL